MQDSEKQEFLDVMDETADLYGKKIPTERVAVYWKALSHRELNEIKAAINRHIQDPERGRFFPLPADVAAQLPSEHSLWLEADEAWALAPKDESSSSAMCDEMAEALGVAGDLIASGDMVAARMAFKATYNRLTDDAKREGRKPKWWASLGHEPTGRHAAEVKAVEMNNLYLPSSERLALPEPENNGFMGLERLGEEAAKHSTDPEKAKEHIKKFKTMLGADDE